MSHISGKDWSYSRYIPKIVLIFLLPHLYFFNVANDIDIDIDNDFYLQMK